MNPWEGCTGFGLAAQSFASSQVYEILDHQGNSVILARPLCILPFALQNTEEVDLFFILIVFILIQDWIEKELANLNSVTCVLAHLYVVQMQIIAIMVFKLCFSGGHVY